MSDDNNITAIWEEDGDLMRLKVFFGYTRAEDELKKRIKEKTISKISETDNNIPSPTSTDEITSESEEVKGTNKIRSFFTGPKRKWSKARKHATTFIGVAAVVMLAVYMGTNGMLMGDKTQNSSAQQKNMADSTLNESYDRDSGTAGGVAPEIATDYTTAKTSSGSVPSDSNYENSKESLTADSAAPTEKLKSAVNNPAEQKIIYSLDVSLKTKDVIAAAKALEEKAKALGGYVADSTVSNDDNAVTAYLSLKIPAKQYEAFKSGLPQYGTVASEHQYTEDVSSAYFDTETRLRSWEAQEQRYLEILKKANTVEDILKIENSLATVRQEIESMKGQLKYWDSRVEYSQVTINIVPLQSNLSVKDPWQPISLHNTLLAIKNALIKTVSFLWNALNYLLVFIGYALPVVIILLVIWLIYRAVRKRKKVQNKSQE